MTLSKASVYIRPVGSVETTASFVIPETGSVSIEASNFYKLDQGDPNLVFDAFEFGFFSSGYLRTGTQNGATATWPTVSYPISAEKAGRYRIFVRLRIPSFTSSQCDFNISINSNVVQQISEIITPNVWIWIETHISVPDSETFDLSITPKTENLLIDAIHISKDELPEVIEFDAPYATLHMKMFEIDSDLSPSVEIPVYGFKTSRDDIRIDDWYNFSLSPLPGQSEPSFDVNYALALYASGATGNHYFLWDYSTEELPTIDPYNPVCSLIFNNETRKWDSVCDKRYAIKLYSYKDSLDASAEAIVTPASALSNRIVEEFDSSVDDPIFVNTGTVPVTATTNKVQLQLPDRIISILVDQSGSMTWNDSPGLRHELSRRMISRIDSTYPGNVKWNIFSFEGTPLRLNFFAVVENDTINTNDIDAVASSFFADQESGYAGVRVVRKLGSYPDNALDGEIVTEGFVDRAFDDNLGEGVEYFYTAYTFDGNGTFSQGVEINATPHQRIIPYGIGQFSANILRGSGVRKDSLLLGAWHLDEGAGSIAYDFTSSQMHLTYTGSEDPIWLNSDDVPIGTSGVRLDGSTMGFRAQDSNGTFNRNEVTIMGWIFPFSDSGDEAIFCRENASATDFCLGRLDDQLYFTVDYALFVYSSTRLNIGEWNHVAVRFNKTTKDVKLYLNGAPAADQTYGGVFNDISGSICLGDPIRTEASPFFGRITEFSFHRTLRSDAYIASAAVQPSSPNDKVLDNGDRMIILNYTVPQDFNFEGGNVRILEKVAAGEAEFSFTGNLTDDGKPEQVNEGYGFPPFHENDGDIIYSESASAGNFSLTLHDDFVHNRVYHYKIFSQNTIGNFSNWSDSPVLSITIPPFDNEHDMNRAVPVPSPALPMISSVTVQPGNRKNYIRWTYTSTDERVAQVRVYYSPSAFPIFGTAEQTNAAQLIFNGTKDQIAFVHRNIDNNAAAHYAIVTMDEYGQRSDPYYFQSIPSETASEVGIPLLEVKKLRYELVNENALSLAWDQPIKLQKNIEGWFDQRVALFAQITDEFGAPIADDSRISFVADASVSSSQNAENVFGETIDRSSFTPMANETFVLNSIPQGNGIIKGLVRMVGDFNIISAINDLTLSVRVFFAIPDRNDPTTNVFEYKSLPVTIHLSNPFKAELVNQSGDSITHLCKLEVPLSDPEFIASGGADFNPNLEKNFDGTYIRRSRPFVARMKVSYRDAPIPSGGNIYAAVLGASDPACDDPNDRSKSFIPSFSDSLSHDVQPRATTFELSATSETDHNGIETFFSYADIELRPPQTPQGVMLFTQASYNGYIARKKLYIAFENILRVELTLNEPEPNCIDQPEQFASVYLIDPDSPSPSRPNRLGLPDHEICKWNLNKGISGRDRPFFSLDTIPNGPGIFSYVRQGTARRVFFGPACGVTWTIVDVGPEKGGSIQVPEMYAIKASVIHDGLSAFEERPLVIFPQDETGGFGSKMLMQFSDMLKNLYADGYAYETLSLFRDPNSASGSFANAFRACASQFGGTLFILNYGQPVEIESGDEFEILFGEALSIELDPYIDEFVFHDATQEIGFATVPLDSSGDVTSVYLRINKFIGPHRAAQSDDNDHPIQNRCSEIEVPAGFRAEPADKVVVGRTSILVNNETRYLTGGGDLANGIPPTVLRLKEPLAIRIVDVRVNGVPVEHLVVDGQTEHTVLVEVSFSDKPVPDGTPILLQVGGTNPSKIQLYSELIYTSQFEDSHLLTGVKSYAQFRMYPLNPTESFSAQVQAECRYDKRGDVVRSMTACVTITYDAQAPVITNPDGEHGEVNNVFSAALSSYDSVNDTWSDKASMNHGRGALTLTYSGGKAYAIGGINGKSVTSYNEAYDIASDTWTELSLMPTPRFYHIASVYSGDIYVFGGITVENGALTISTSVEKYSVSSGAWTTLGPMPTINGSAYGLTMASAIQDGSLLYFLSGISSIDGQGGIRNLNDRVLVYDFTDDSWSYSDVLSSSELVLFQRVAPVGFKDTDDSSIHVVGGAIPVGTGANQTLEFLTDAFTIDKTLLTVSADDSSYSNIPLPRYKGGVASVGNAHYCLGGANKKTIVLKTFEKIDASADPFAFADKTEPSVAKQSFGIDSDNSRYVYVAGGVTSGRPSGFLQVRATARPDRIRLDGKQSAGIDIELLDDAGEHPTHDVRVLLRGYLIFPNSRGSPGEGSGGSDQGQQSSDADRSALVYPVIFSSNDFVISNGIGSTTLLPRAEDILLKIDEIKRKLGITEQVVGEGTQDNALLIEEGQVREPYSIRIQITILDDFFYGQTVVDIQDNQDSGQSSGSSSSGDNGSQSSGSSGSSGSSEPPGPSFANCIEFSGSQGIAQHGSDGQVGDPNSDPVQEGLDSHSLVFNLNPQQTPQLESPQVSFYSDIEWIPQVISHLDSNDGTAERALEIVKDLEDSVPFGGSPFYDGIVSISETLLNDAAFDFTKSIYAYTDNEENLSLIGLDEAIEDVQSIAGFGRTPVVLANFSVVFPTTLSALVDRTDTDSLERLANETGGQSQTVLDDAFVDEVLNNSLGRLAGSVGWGTYEAVVDLGESSVIHTIYLGFELFENTDGNWMVSTSEDGFNFDDNPDQYDPNDQVEFFRLNGRYLRFRVTLLSGLSASISEAYEDVATPGVPALLSINIGYSVPQESFIFVNSEHPLNSAQQIAAAVRANRPTSSIIDVGAATSESTNWDDFHFGAQPAADQYGKIFIPIRTHQEDANLDEPLTSIDGIIWRTRYGPWNPTSVVTIRDSSGGVIDSNDYKVFARNGLIVFATKQVGPFIIDIENSSITRLGIRVVNKISDDPVRIEGFGYFYNTNVFLPPPLSEQAPEATNLVLLPSDPTMYSTITASYKFFDINRDSEDTAQTELRWYINGIEKEFLRGLLSWNNINNTDDPIWVYGFTFSPSDVPAGKSIEEFARSEGESLVKTGDIVYFTVKPSDGTLFGEVVRSASITILPAPPFVTNLVIKGRTSGGAVQSTVTTGTTAFANYNFFDDGGSNTSTIIWYVNGVEFKRGDLGGTTNGLLNNELLPGERQAGTATLAIILGNNLEVEIRPAAGQTLGSPIRAAVVTVGNSIPTVLNVIVSPSNPTSTSNLQVTYTFSDVDIVAGATGQSNESSIRWFRKRGSADFEEVTSVFNQQIVPSTLTVSGDQWYAQIIPFDGVSVGTAVNSNTVTIS